MKQSEIVLVSADARLLHVQFKPGVELGDLARLFTAVRELAAERRVKSILIDARGFRQPVTVVQRMAVAQAVVQAFLGCRVAGVVSVETFDPKLLAETMARNRGGNVKFTTSLPEALKWLKRPTRLLA